MSTWRRGGGWLAAVGLVAALALPALDAIRAQAPPARRIPHIETRAPGAFDGERPVLTEAEARYQVNATVVIPFLVASVPLAEPRRCRLRQRRRTRFRRRAREGAPNL